MLGVDGDGAAVGLGDGAGDGQTEAGAAVVAGAGGVEAGEALEDPLGFGRRDARAVVGDRQLGEPVVGVGG